MSRPDPSIAACRWLPFRGAVDPRGCINFVENATDLDFAFQRAFWIHGVPAGQNRGHHAHRDARLVIVALSGAADMVIDDGRCRETVRLDQPDLGMLVGTWVWHELHDFAPNTVILVLASTGYAESDYIRDYDTFVREVAARGTR